MRLPFLLVMQPSPSPWNGIINLPSIAVYREAGYQSYWNILLKTSVTLSKGSSFLVIQWMRKGGPSRWGSIPGGKCQPTGEAFLSDSAHIRANPVKLSHLFISKKKGRQQEISRWIKCWDISMSPPWNAWLRSTENIKITLRLRLNISFSIVSFLFVVAQTF